MAAGFRIRLDRAAASSLTEQISQTIRTAILEGRLEPGARLPSWRDLAAQLGVARGTVRVAYERLADELLVVAAGPSGTHVAEQPPRAARRVGRTPPHEDRRSYSTAPLPFQMGVPAQDALRTCLGDLAGVEAMAGLAMMLRLPPGTDDVAIARTAPARGLAPSALSSWYATDTLRVPGLLLGVTNLIDAGLPHVCARLKELIITARRGTP